MLSEIGIAPFFSCRLSGESGFLIFFEVVALVWGSNVCGLPLARKGKKTRVRGLRLRERLRESRPRLLHVSTAGTLGKAGTYVL